MKVLLLGHKGYLGSYLMDNLDVDVLDERNVYSNGKKYNYVINCIGKPDLEYCENNIETTNYSNCGVINDIIKFYPQSKIINFSSYYVYDDYNLCSENSKVTENYHYCKQKLTSEKLNINGVNFRVGKLFGHPNINKQNKLTEFIIKNDTVKLDNVLFNPTDIKQVTDVIKHELIFNNLIGVYNLSNDGYTSNLNYGIQINKILGGNKKIIKINDPFRNFNNYGKFLMSCDKIKSHVNLTHWSVSLEKYLLTL